MDEEKDFEEKISRTLHAMKHPEAFSEQELRALLSDEECLQACHDLLESKEAMARRYAPAPHVEEEWAKFSARHRRNKKQDFGRIKRICTGIALAVAASIALFLLLHTHSTEYTVFKATAVAQEITLDTREGMNVLTVPRGMNKKIMLADSTLVWLNAESRLEYPETFEGQERRVVRLTGEAYFEVAKDATRPFIVETDFLETLVTGTSFNIHAYSSEDAHVTLVEGSVQVSDLHTRKGVLMKPGQNALLQKQGNFAIREVKAETCHRWAEGLFYFDNTELLEIMRELGRWYNIDIIFTNKQAMHYRMHFQSERTDSLAQVLDLLNSMQKVKARLEKGQVIIGL